MKYVIELTNACNLKCEMCPRNYIDMEIGFMSETLWKDTLETIPDGATVLPFWRGEPTLHPDFRNRIASLSGKEVVLATNGTNPDQIIEVLDCLSVVNVSVHNWRSYRGYLKIIDHVKGEKPLVISSAVDGEARYTIPDRVYERHSSGGKWGKVEGMPHLETRPEPCQHLKDVLLTWNGEKGRCTYAWDTSVLVGPYPDEVCLTCDQWQGEGKTL